MLVETATIGFPNCNGKSDCRSERATNSRQLGLAALFGSLGHEPSGFADQPARLQGSGIGPGWVLGILSLAVQAIVFFFVSRGHPITRALTVALLNEFHGPKLE